MACGDVSFYFQEYLLTMGLLRYTDSALFIASSGDLFLKSHVSLKTKLGGHSNGNLKERKIPSWQWSDILCYNLYFPLSIFGPFITFEDFYFQASFIMLKWTFSTLCISLTVYPGTYNLFGGCDSENSEGCDKILHLVLGYGDKLSLYILFCSNKQPARTPLSSTVVTGRCWLCYGSDVYGQVFYPVE